MSGLRLVFQLVTVLSGIEPSASSSTVVAVPFARVHMLLSPSGTSLVVSNVARAKPYTHHKRDLSFHHTLPNGMGFARVFRMSRFIAEPAHHRDLLRPFKYHNRY